MFVLNVDSRLGRLILSGAEGEAWETEGQIAKPDLIRRYARSNLPMLTMTALRDPRSEIRPVILSKSTRPAVQSPIQVRPTLFILLAPHTATRI